MNVQSKRETSAHALHDTETLAERRAEWGREFQWQCGGKTRHAHKHARTHARTFSENMFGHSFAPFKTATTTSAAQFMCGRGGPHFGSKSSEKEASHWFHAISNSYLAHLTSIK